jgi:hypothetical protein
MTMGEFFFGSHRGHLKAKADAIAARHGADHINYTDPGTGERRGWFACGNRGSPFDGQTAAAVMADIDRAGGIESLMYARDR